MVDDRIKADPLDGDPEGVGTAHLPPDVAKPTGAGLVLDPRLGDEERPTIPVVRLAKHVAQRQMLWVGRHEHLAFVDPLVVDVVVHADHVQVTGLAAQLGPGPPGDHVPRLELGEAVAFGGQTVLRSGRIRDDVDDRVGMDDARIGPAREDLVAGLDGRAHELRLDLTAALSRVRVEEALLTGRKREEGNLIDGRDERRPAVLAGQNVEEGPDEPSESLRKGRGEDVHVIGPSEVEQIPDDLGIRLPCRAKHGENAVPRVSAGHLFHPVPPDAVARRLDADVPKAPVVLAREAVVPRALDQVEAATVLSAVGRALEAAEEEAPKERLARLRRHGGPGVSGQSYDFFRANRKWPVCSCPFAAWVQRCSK